MFYGLRSRLWPQRKMCYGGFHGASHSRMLRSSLRNHVTVGVIALTKQQPWMAVLHMEPGFPSCLLPAPGASSPAKQTSWSTKSSFKSSQCSAVPGFLGMVISSSRLSCHVQTWIILWEILLWCRAPPGAEKFSDYDKTPASWINFAVAI